MYKPAYQIIYLNYNNHHYNNGKDHIKNDTFSYNDTIQFRFRHECVIAPNSNEGIRNTSRYLYRGALIK